MPVAFRRSATSAQGDATMAAPVGNRTRPSAVTAGVPPSSAEHGSRPLADENDGPDDTMEDVLSPWDEDDSWPAQWGAARLGIP